MKQSTLKLDSVEFQNSRNETSRTTESTAERKKLAARIAQCIVNVLLFWKICKKKGKIRHA